MKQYFYLDSNNVQQGPVAGERLTSYGVKPNTLVWAEGMADWQQASAIEELRPVFSQSVPPPTPTPDYGNAYQKQERPQPQPQPTPNAGMIKPDNNLVWGILCTLLCCLPLGVISIIKATNVDTKWANGDFAGAIEDAKSARNWALWGAISSLIGGGIYLIVYVICIAVAAANGGF